MRGDENMGQDGADQRLALIEALADEQLTYYFVLLSDERIVRNVPSLPLIEAEMRARDLPGVRRH